MPPYHTTPGDPHGLPDYTLPVSVVAQLIDTLRVDIAAASIGPLAIEIVGQSGPITITIGGVSNGVVFNVAQSGSWTVNAAQSGSWTVNAAQTGAWTINIGQPLDASGNLKTSIQSSVTLNVNIMGQSTTININIASISAGVIFNVAQSGSWTVNAQQTGTWTVNAAQSGSWTVNAAQTGAWTINIGQPLDASGNLKTSIQSSVTLNVNISSQSTTLNVNIASITGGVVFNVAQSGTWTVNAQQTGTWNVNISGTPTINIQTSGGANIVVDKLTTSSVYAFRTNYNDTTGTPTAFSVALNRAYAKFYARGMRGYIQRIYFWVNGPRATDATVYAGICIDPASPPIYEASTTVTAGTDPGWFYVNIYKWWPYDSLLIYVRTGATGTIQFGRDTSNLGSGLYSDNLTDWTLDDYRYYLYVAFYAHQNVHLPVSGTVSTIAVPNTTSFSKISSTPVAQNSTVTIFSTKCSGELKYLRVGMQSNVTVVHVYADGVEVISDDAEGLYTDGVGASTPGISLTKYASGGTCVIVYTIPIQWKRTLEIKIENGLSTTIYAWARIVYTKTT